MTPIAKMRRVHERLNRRLGMSSEHAKPIREKKRPQVERLDRCHLCGESISFEDLQFLFDEGACAYCTAVFRRMMAD
jgi:hypothetical protein